MLRVVIDTNVMVSALISKGKPRQLVARLLTRHRVVSCAAMFEELAEVLAREKFHLTMMQIDRYLSVYAAKSEVVIPRLNLRAIAEDPDDDIVLSTAVEGNAGYIVSGDGHLLTLRTFRGTRIVTVDEALKILDR